MFKRSELSKRIVEAVNRMPARVRKVYILSHYHGLSLRAIAGTLEIEEREAKSLLRCGNTMLYRTVPVP